MKKHLNRIAVDLCTPTAERRPTTAEDIRNDVFIEDFRNSKKLYEFVLDLTNMDDEDVIYELGGDDTVENKIKYLLGFCMDPGDGSPNIQYCCVDGKELDDVLTYDAFDDVDFDDADSKTLVDILLDEYEYSEDDDEWDDDDEEEDEVNDKTEKFWYEVHSDEDENNIYRVFYDRDEALKYARDNIEERTWVDEIAYYGDEDDEEIDSSDIISINTIWTYADDEEEKIEEDMDLKYKKGEPKMIDNKIKKFAELLEKNGFEDNGMDASFEVNDKDVAYKDHGGYFSLTLVDKEEEIYLFKERDYETNHSYTLVIRGDEQFEDFLKDFKRNHVLDNDLNEEVDVDSVDKKLMDRLLKKVRRAMDEGQYYLEPTKEELKRFITILIEERGMDEWEYEDWELLADSFFDHKEDSLDEILEWDYDINLDEVE